GRDANGSLRRIARRGSEVAVIISAFLRDFHLHRSTLGQIQVDGAAIGGELVFPLWVQCPGIIDRPIPAGADGYLTAEVCLIQGDRTCLRGNARIAHRTLLSYIDVPRVGVQRGTLA